MTLLRATMVNTIYQHKNAFRVMAVLRSARELWRAAIRNLLESPYVRPEQGSQSYMLKLPTELLIDIANLLSVQDRAILAQVCRSLRAVFESPSAPPSSPTTLPVTDYVDYLTVLARERPDKWVCEWCLSLHQMRSWDLPWQVKHTVCGCLKRQMDMRVVCWPRQRHIQQTLKLSRLALDDAYHTSYLAKLLSPHCETFYPAPEKSYGIKGLYTMEPRVRNGRYLLRCTWTYNDVNLTTKALCQGSEGGLDMCPHQRLVSGPKAARRMKRRRRTITRVSTHHQDPCTEELLAAVRQVLTRYPWIDEVDSHCPHCPTDFSVHVFEDEGNITAWYDLGTEGPPGNQLWMAHFMTEHPFGHNPKYDIKHRRGAIRALYEGEKRVNAC